jgi:hypothetical protein
MLGSLMLDRVGGEVDGTNVVTIDHGGTAKRMTELLQELAQPYASLTVFSKLYLPLNLGYSLHSKGSCSSHLPYML